MAESPRAKPVHRLSADAADYELSLTPRKSDDEVALDLSEKKAESEHRRILELKAADAHHRAAAQMRLALGIIAACCLIFIGVHGQVDDLSRAACTLLMTIVTGAFAYIAGQKAGKS
jgi:hypothetical protein